MNPAPSHDEASRRRIGRTGIGWGIGALGIVGIGVLALFLWPFGDDSEDAPSTSGSPSREAQPSARTEIPWEEVGPGWTLLVYDREPEMTEWGEEWSRTGDELWLLAPDGTVFFAADISGLDATSVEAFTGREVWLYRAESWEGESSSGTQYTVDLAEGTTAVVAEDSPPRGWYEPTAFEGVYLTRSGCCGCVEVFLHDRDGRVRQLNEGCGETSVSPDGTAVAYVTERQVGGVYRSTFTVADLEGNAHAVAVSPLSDTYHQILWLDEDTLLVYPGGDDHVWVLAAVDLDSGDIAPWPPAPPPEYFLDIWAVSPGSWLTWTSYEPFVRTRITDREGVVALDLECEFAGCWSRPTGDYVLWEESDVEFQDGVRVGEDFQRITLIDPRTGDRTVVVEFLKDDGHITALMPHPPVYG